MATGENVQAKRRIIRTGTAVAALAAVATAGWYGFLRGDASLAELSGTDRVDTASHNGKAEARDRLEKLVDALPGAPRRFDDAASDHCLRHVPFEGEPAGPMTCQWRLEQYVVLDDDLRTAGDAWDTMLGDQGWTGEYSGFPSSAGTSERFGYHHPRTRDRLVVTLVQDGGELHFLNDFPSLEPFEKHEREGREFSGHLTAKRALAEGRRVARVSLFHAYYGETGGPPPEPSYA
ncbi:MULTISPECIES: hypothetical protein [unclassified Streptomyces]|uniref:hypothetical protein n=1 Tax=unclassified Streptomyces TaxID=2593676 RepID=UPI0022B6E9CB|nr:MULTISPECIES: hypothetical protein [unclassified Streptomyces]MCZ7417313.1 hypothetical protein [Streptomyces sp. WMMC897]MCZ7432860.1 hypothetical protein [Streptomyces sp. WMMC1477]